MRDRFAAKNPRSWMLRFHTQTAGSSLTAQQPINNVVRTALEAMSAVLGGTQSLHTNGFDEALGLPTEMSAEIALRTQQVIAHESGAAAVADPLGGSHYVEWLTDRVEDDAERLMAEIDEQGGALAVIESGGMQKQIADSAYRFQRRVESGERIIVGVNKYSRTAQREVEITKVEPRHEEEQREAVRRARAERDKAAASAALDELEDAARGTENQEP
jgi:methylmalonyl-CoA mutase N-terminal domain/subunit